MSDAMKKDAELAVKQAQAEASAAESDLSAALARVMARIDALSKDARDEIGALRNHHRLWLTAEVAVLALFLVAAIIAVVVR